MPIKYRSYKTTWRRIKRWQDERVWDRILRALASIRSCEISAVDSSTVEAKGGGVVGYDGLKHKKCSKIHVANNYKV